MSEPIKMPTYQEKYNRLVRAVLLADVMQATGITPQMAAMADDQDWATAGLAIRNMGEEFSDRVPSNETQKLAISLLQRRESWAERFKK